MFLQQCYEEYPQFNEHGNTSLKQLSVVTTRGRNGGKWRCPLHKASDHSFNECKAYKQMQAKLQKAQRNAATRRQQRPPRTPPARNGNKDKGKVCHYCKKTAHIVKDCKKRKADEVAKLKNDDQLRADHPPIRQQMMRIVPRNVLHYSHRIPMEPPKEG